MSHDDRGLRPRHPLPGPVYQERSRVHTLPPHGQDPGHRRRRIHRLAPGPRARRARRRAAAARAPQHASSSISTTSSSSACTGDVTDRRAVRRAMKDVDRVFHVAGTTSLRPQDARAGLRGQRRRHPDRARGGARGRVERVGPHLVGRARSARRPRGRPPTRPALPRRRARDRLRQLQARGGGRGDAGRRRAACHVVVVNPTFVLGPDDPKTTSMGLVRRFLLRRIPVYVDGGLNIVDVRDVATRPPPRRREGHRRASATSSAGATSPSTASSPTSRGSPASGRPRCSCRPARRSAGTELAGGRRLPLAGLRRRGALGGAVVDLPHGKAKRELGFKAAPARGDARTRPSTGSSTSLGDRVGRGGGRLDRSSLLPRSAGALRAGREDRGPVSDEVVLYRCRTPTNVLCPCGAVERRLRKLEVEHRGERVAAAARAGAPRSRS